jgi:hypothetical protein
MARTYILVDEQEFLDLKENVLAIRKAVEELKPAVSPQTYSETEAARYLKVCTKTLKKLRDQGKIGFCKDDFHGRRIVYQEKHIQEYLKRFEHKKLASK